MNEQINKPETEFSASHLEDSEELREWENQRMVLQKNLDSAENLFKNSKGRDEYTLNIRARDQAKKALENHLVNELDIRTSTLEGLDKEIEKVNADLMRAIDSKEHNTALRKLEHLLKKSQQLKKI